MDIRVIIKIDVFISRQRTGNPAEFARKVHVSERTLFNYLDFMRVELGAPILYNKYAKTYQYSEVGEFQFKYKKKVLTKIS